MATKTKAQLEQQIEKIVQENLDLVKLNTFLKKKIKEREFPFNEMRFKLEEIEKGFKELQNMYSNVIKENITLKTEVTKLKTPFWKKLFL